MLSYFHKLIIMTKVFNEIMDIIFVVNISLNYNVDEYKVVLFLEVFQSFFYERYA